MNRREVLKQAVLVMGYTIAAPALMDILAGCNNGQHSTEEPRFFSRAQLPVIAELAESILPRTTTPGAKDLHLEQFMDRLLGQVLSPADQQSFLKGMDTFEEEAKKVNGKSFVDSSPEQRHQLLTKLEQETEMVPPSVWGISLKKDAGPVAFYRQVKELTLLGYFTSKEIGKEVLLYDPVPGQFIADLPTAKAGHISFE